MSDTRSESSSYTPLISDDEVQTSFTYLKGKVNEFIKLRPKVFDLNLKTFFKDIVSEEEKYIDYNLLSEEILTPSGNVLNFLNKYGNLYNFWTDALLEHINSNDIRSQQTEFLKDLMNGFEVYKNIAKPKGESNYKTENLYLKLLGAPNKNVDEILFLKTTMDQCIKGKNAA